MIPTQILRVLSTIQTFDVPALLMGGQACVLYGAAEYSRDLDLVVLASPEAWPKLTEAMRALRSTVIAVPPFEALYLERGHGVHLSVPDERSPALRVDLMSRMRGVDPFDALWERRVTIVLPSETIGDVAVEMLGLEDLVAAKKTQRDKDWPMIRRLVDASYAAGRDGDVTDHQVAFWMAELRSPEFLHELVLRFPEAAVRSDRPAVGAALGGGDVAHALAAEQAREMAEDAAYWRPLRRELEALRHASRRQ